MNASSPARVSSTISAYPRDRRHLRHERRPSFRAHQARTGQDNHWSAILEELFPASRRAPIVTILDVHPHTLALIAAAASTPAVHLGVTTFGAFSHLDSVYRHHGSHADTIVRAAPDALHR